MPGLTRRSQAATATASFLYMPASCELGSDPNLGQSLRTCQQRRTDLGSYPNSGYKIQTLERPVMTSTARFPISVEFFSPKTPQGVEKLRLVRQQLYALKPEFCSVTFGAGGSTQEGTFNTVRDILAECVNAASHLSCISATRVKVREQLAILKTLGVKRMVALRGDLPSGFGTAGEFQYASDLVAFIRSETGSDFHIHVAAYPEVHPQARSPQSDLQAFASKMKAGADSAITQYFYNPDAYFRFVEEVDALGLNVPVVPGVMPIASSTQLIRFSDACGAEIPRRSEERRVGKECR